MLHDISRTCGHRDDSCFSDNVMRSSAGLVIYVAVSFSKSTNYSVALFDVFITRVAAKWVPYVLMCDFDIPCFALPHVSFS